MINNNLKIFYNPGLLGDIIYSIPFCLSCVGTYCKNDLSKNKFTFLIDTLISHKEKGIDDAFNSLCLLRDLLLTQPYFEKIVCEKRIDFGPLGALDLGKMRKGYVDMYKGDIVLRYRFEHRTIDFYDCEDPWIILPKDENYNQYKDKIIVFRSSRYHNHKVNYSILKKYEKDMIFIGYENEYKNFISSSLLSVPFYFPKSFIDVAQIFNHCRFVIGNQTMYFAIAEAMKVPRLVEMSTTIPDVIPKGKFGNDFVDTNDLVSCVELYLENL